MRDPRHFRAWPMTEVLPKLAHIPDLPGAGGAGGGPKMKIRRYPVGWNLVRAPLFGLVLKRSSKGSHPIGCRHFLRPTSNSQLPKGPRTKR